MLFFLNVTTLTTLSTSFHHLSITHTPPYHHPTALELSLQTNLAWLEQVLNFIIICLDPPLLGCQPECEQETGRVTSWGECWKACKVAVGGLACLGYKATLFCLYVLFNESLTGTCESWVFLGCAVQLLFLSMYRVPLQRVPFKFQNGPGNKNPLVFLPAAAMLSESPRPPFKTF